MNKAAWLDGFSLSSVVDIAVMTFVIYGTLLWLRRTRRSALILTGILIVAGLYVVALWFDMVLTTSVLQGFFAIFLLALVVIFQEELRYFFERIAQWSLRPRLPGLGAARRRLDNETLTALTRTLADLAEERIGALVVFRGRDLITRHLRGGNKLDGLVSDAALKSIFDEHSEGHDGAVIIDRDRVDSFGCHLPLSSDFEQLRGMGTRHAAALGISEVTDALCLVVSEERGSVSAARNSTLRRLESQQEVSDLLRDFYDEVAPVHRATRWRDALKRNWREKLIAPVIAAGLWLGLVHGSVTISRRYPATIELSGLPQHLIATTVEPETAVVTLTGARRDFVLFKPARLRLNPRAWDLEAGVHALPISGADLSLPGGKLAVERLEPRQLTVHVAARELQP